MTASVEGLAGGDHTVAIADTDRKDEVGLIARALLVFRDALIAKRQTDDKNAQHEQREIDRQSKITRAIAQFEALPMQRCSPLHPRPQSLRHRPICWRNQPPRQIGK